MISRKKSPVKFRPLFFCGWLFKNQNNCQNKLLLMGQLKMATTSPPVLPLSVPSLSHSKACLLLKQYSLGSGGMNKRQRRNMDLMPCALRERCDMSKDALQPIKPRMMQLCRMTFNHQAPGAALLLCSHLD